MGDETDLLLADCISCLNLAVESARTADGCDIAVIRIQHVLNSLEGINLPRISMVNNLLTNALILLEDRDGRILCTRGCGRPEIPIPMESLEYLLSLDFKVPKIAELFRVSTRTIYNRMSSYELSVSATYTNINDEILDQAIQDVLLNYPNTGYKRMRGFPRAKSIKVTVSRIRESMARVDAFGVEARRRENRTIHRREYFVKYSMEMWHIDTHHKLIRWGIVVRGGIDGKSRTIVYLDAGNDNTAASNLKSFMSGVQKYGVPQRTRSDKGGENVLVAQYMLTTRGTGRCSHICGRSVHNQRIERLCRDVFYGCLSTYKSLFIWLEEQGKLQIDNPKHVAAIQIVFLPRIRQHLKEFMEAWNVHPLSSEQNKTPLQLMLIHLPPQDYDLTMDFNVDSISRDIGIDNSSQSATIMASNPPVSIENFQSYLSEDEMAIAREIDFMAASDCMGADIYLQFLDQLGS